MHSILRVLLFAGLTQASVAFAHDAEHKIQEYTGLKSPEVIVNDMRLRGIEVSDITLKGRQAEVTTLINGQSIKWQVHRQTGALTQISGAVLAPGILTRDIRLRPVIRPDFRLRLD